MSDVAGLLASAINLEAVYGDQPVQLPRGMATKMAKACLAALDIADYQIVQKPLTLTPEMAALCEQEAVHIFKTRRIPGMRDG